MGTDNRQARGADYTEIVPYTDVERADKYAASQLSLVADAWATLTDAQKLKALRSATLDIDELTYVGYRLYVSQDREWPRYLSLGTVGDVYEQQDSILEFVADATCEQAMYLAYQYINGYDQRARQDQQHQGANSLSRVGASENYDLTKARRHQLCRKAYQILEPYIVKTATLNDPYDPTPGY